MAAEVFRGINDVPYEIRGLELLWSWLHIRAFDLRATYHLNTLTATVLHHKLSEFRISEFR